MKQNVVNLTKIFSYFRGWLKRKKVPHTGIQTPAHISSITTPEGVLRLCCNMVRKKEMYVRAQAKRLHPLTTQKIVEPGASDGYKGLRIESEEYALWCELFDLDRKPGKGKEFICCQTVLLYFYGSTKLNAFLKELRDQEYFQCVWDHLWLNLEEEPVKITLKMSKTPRLPHCFIFEAWNNKR